MWRKWIITVGGLGLMRPAPGTWGSLPPCALVFGAVLLGWSAEVINVLLLALLVATAAACLALGTWAERQYLGKDPGVVVADETAGMSLTLLFVPLSAATDAAAAGEWTGALAAGGQPQAGFALMVISAAFVLFRILDIVKAQPAHLVQQFPAGWGILLDDIVAALYGNLILQVFLRGVLPMLA